MKKKGLIITLAIIVLLAVAAFVLHRMYGQSTTYDDDFYIEDTSTITKIYIADKLDNQVLLTRVPNDTTWMVNDQYEASQPLVRSLLGTLNTMRIRNRVNKAAAKNEVKLLAGKSTKVEIYQNVYRIDWFNHHWQFFPHEKLTNTYYVGHETQDLLGTIMLREGDKWPVVVHIPGFRGFVGPQFITNPLLWRSHRIVDLPVSKIERIELNIPAVPSESFAICREGEGFYMEMLENHQRVDGFDTARVAQFLSSFTNLNFDEYAAAVPKTELDTTFSKPPRTILRIKDTEGNEHVLKTYLKYNNPDDIINMPDPEMYEVFDLDRLYAVLDDKDTVLIQYFVFDNILQHASFFRGAAINNPTIQH